MALIGPCFSADHDEEGLAIHANFEEKSKESSDKSYAYLKDTALVRLGGQVFFLKDVEKLQVSYKSLSCIGENSYIERFLKASRESLIPRSWQVNNIEKGSSLPQQLEAFILIEKLKLSSISSASTKLTTFDLAQLSKNCSALNLKNLSSGDKSLFISELYLRQRFSTSKDLNKSMEEYVKSLNLQHKHELLRIKPSKRTLDLLQREIDSEKNKSNKE